MRINTVTFFVFTVVMPQGALLLGKAAQAGGQDASIVKTAEKYRKAVLAGDAARSPVGRVRDLDGQVLLLGVGHDANTTLHLAELLAGVPYRTSKYCTILQNGRPVRIDYGENDHCCQRFALADEWLRSGGL